MPTRVLIPSGVLGLSYCKEALRRGLDLQPDLIAIDGGSTDSGPYYLGAGISKYSRSTTLSDWKTLLSARAQTNVPLVLTSAGTSGTDSCVDWMLEITREAASQLGHKLKVATLKSSQNHNCVAKKFTQRKLHELANAPEIEENDILGCTNIVALAGVEQIAAAIQIDADIIIAGRATDTAGIAALPIINGEHVGSAWHGAKIAECGALCSTQPLSGVICVEFDKSGFEVEPLAELARCTPYSVSAHMLYENADPFILLEPGGELNVKNSHYHPISEKRVRVEGSAWTNSDVYTVKLEGAKLAGYQSAIMSILRNRRYVNHIIEWVKQLETFINNEIENKTNFSIDEMGFNFRLVGLSGALGELESYQSSPTEVGVLCIVTASSQQIANEVAKLINPYLLHFPLADEDLPTFAFPFSPAEFELGPLYEFCLNHVMELDDPMEVFRLELLDV